MRKAGGWMFGSGYLLNLMKYPIAPCDFVSILLASIVLGVDATNHYEEAHSDGLADLDEFALVGYMAMRCQFGERKGLYICDSS